MQDLELYGTRASITMRLRLRLLLSQKIVCMARKVSSKKRSVRALVQVGKLLTTLIPPNVKAQTTPVDSLGPHPGPIYTNRKT